MIASPEFDKGIAVVNGYCWATTIHGPAGMSQSKNEPGADLPHNAPQLYVLPKTEKREKSERLENRETWQSPGEGKGMYLCKKRGHGAIVAD